MHVLLQDRDILFTTFIHHSSYIGQYKNIYINSTINVVNNIFLSTNFNNLGLGAQTNRRIETVLYFWLRDKKISVWQCTLI